MEEMERMGAWNQALWVNPKVWGSVAFNSGKKRASLVPFLWRGNPALRMGYRDGKGQFLLYLVKDAPKNQKTEKGIL